MGAHAADGCGSDGGRVSRLRSLAKMPESVE
jgi:hypothetical protein